MRTRAIVSELLSWLLVAAIAIAAVFFLTSCSPDREPTIPPQDSNGNWIEDGQGRGASGYGGSR